MQKTVMPTLKSRWMTAGKETTSQMTERIRKDPIKNHCAHHGVILYWIDGRCAHCVHREECGNKHGLRDCAKWPLFGGAE